MLLDIVFNYIGFLVKKRDGQAMVEYVLLVGFIALIVIGALMIFGPALTASYNSAVDAINDI